MLNVAEKVGLLEPCLNMIMNFPFNEKPDWCNVEWERLWALECEESLYILLTVTWLQKIYIMNKINENMQHIYEAGCVLLFGYSIFLVLNVCCRYTIYRIQCDIMAL